MNEFIGSRLTHGSFLQMSQEIYTEILNTTPEALKLEVQAPLYADAITRLSNLVQRQTGYAETVDVTRADANRDALWMSIYYAVDYLRHLDPTSSLYPHVQRLLPAISPYKGMARHELTKETSEIEGFLAVASQTDNLAALKALGLEKLLAALTTENDKLKTSATTRTGSAATRAIGTGDETTDQVRRQTVDLYRQIAARVNAVQQLESTPAVVAFISKVNAIADHYTTVMANQGKTAKNDANANEEIKE